MESDDEYAPHLAAVIAAVTDVRVHRVEIRLPETSRPFLLDGFLEEKPADGISIRVYAPGPLEPGQRQEASFPWRLAAFLESTERCHCCGGIKSARYPGVGWVRCWVCDGRGAPDRVLDPAAALERLATGGAWPFALDGDEAPQWENGALVPPTLLDLLAVAGRGPRLLRQIESLAWQCVEDSSVILRWRVISQSRLRDYHNLARTLYLATGTHGDGAVGFVFSLFVACGEPVISVPRGFSERKLDAMRALLRLGVHVLDSYPRNGRRVVELALLQLSA